MGRIYVYHIQGTSPDDVSNPSTMSSGTIATTSGITQIGSALLASPAIYTVGPQGPQGPRRSNKINKNVNYRVATYDVESAVKMAKEKYPNITITAVSMKDKLDDVDPMVVLEIFNNGKDKEENS